MIFILSSEAVLVRRLGPGHLVLGLPGRFGPWRLGMEERTSRTGHSFSRNVWFLAAVLRWINLSWLRNLNGFHTNNGIVQFTFVNIEAKHFYKNKCIIFCLKKYHKNYSCRKLYFFSSMKFFPTIHCLVCLLSCAECNSASTACSTIFFRF